VVLDLRDTSLQQLSLSPLLELAGIEKSFGPIGALRGAALTAERGEIVGVCGDSGSGKSTLIGVLGGLHPGYRGRVLIDGVEQHLKSPADARRAGIAVVHPKPVLVPHLSVAQNLMLGREPRRYGLVDGARLESQGRALLERFGVDGEISPSALVAQLSLAQQQVVELVRALSHDPRVLVLDEPAALLVSHQRERLFAWLRGFRSGSSTCIYASHKMDDVLAVCDRVVLLRDGKTAQTRATAPRAPSGGRYAVHDEIASGGMATVHIGRVLGPFGFTSTVAIKRLHPQLAKDPQFVAQFLDEARLASRVRHPNVVPVLDVFAEEGELSLVMEYVDGESLAHLQRAARRSNAPVPVPIAVAIATSVLHGLHAAHEARDEKGESLGLVHRDVSPQNVIVGSDGVVRLIDFGIAKAIGRSNVSREGQLKGKIAYMAPEQIQRGVVNRSTDVYGASVLLWELLAGEQLFDGEGEGMILGRVLDDVVPPPSSLHAGLAEPLDAITLKGLDRRQDRRFESALAMVRELETVLRPAGPREIGEWVEALAKENLAERRARVARIEGG
jgi:ABC-type multidrug transport system ATPase subunit